MIASGDGPPGSGEGAAAPRDTAATRRNHPPLHDGAGPAAPDPLTREPERPDTRAAVLLVDDHRENLAALQAVLEPLGERLIRAESGDQALRVLLREDVAVVLLDVRMAGLDGLQTARIIRTRPRTRHIPIIFLTAQASDLQEIAAAYASGAVDYVIKPFEPEILRAKVSVFVELNRERAERVRQSRARAEAETVARTVRTLQILSDAAIAHLEMDALAAELVERATTLFQADAGALLLVDDSGARLTVLAHRGAPLPELGGQPVRLGSGVLGRLAMDRQPALLQGVELSGPAPGDASGQDAEEPILIESLLAVPLVTGDALLGLLLLGAVEEDRFDGADLELLTLAADRMALAVDHVQRFAEGRQLVEMLQRSLLPERLSHDSRLELSARYRPGGLAPQIGGDWYDALELDEGRTAVMIGDVVGHGVRAATTMSELRNSLRALILEGHSPAGALCALNRVVHATIGPGMIATVLVMVIDAEAGTITVARTGHPPPAVRSATGQVRFLETPTTVPLGIDNPADIPEASYPVAPGDMVLLYTDGLVERRREAINVGLQRLREALAGADGDIEMVCDHVLTQTVGDQASHDDVALLAVRLLGTGPGPLSLTLPATPASVPLARHRLGAWLSANAPELDRIGRSDLELAWSEACTNVVRHAYGPVDASFTADAERDGGLVSLTVRDQGRWRPQRVSHGGRGLTLMQAVCDEVEIDRRPDGTTVTMRRRLPPASGDDSGRS